VQRLNPKLAYIPQPIARSWRFAMKRLFLFAVMLCLSLSGLALAKSSTRVKSHTTKKGTYVESHRRTNPDKSKNNNWSTKGNVNPNTGKKGTVDPYKTTTRKKR
jgi:hypothetical protein